MVVEEHGELLRAIAVMEVDVQDGNTINSVFLVGVQGGTDNVVGKAGVWVVFEGRRRETTTTKLLTKIP